MASAAESGGGIDNGATARVEPALTERTRAFWTSGADGVLRIARCVGCGRYQHPPKPVCPACRSRELRSEPVSGRGTVCSWTVNRYQWRTEMPAPYVLAEVELDEQAGLRLLTNIVGCEPEAVHVGLRVEVCFEAVGDAYVPLFRPVGAMSAPVEHSAVISGIGMSEVGRRLHVDPWVLTADAALAAIADAGLTPDDIDGVATYPGALWSTVGITGAGVDDVRSMLGLKLRWYTGGGEVPGPAGLGRQRGDGRRVRAGRARAVLPHGVGVDRPGRAGRALGERSAATSPSSTAGSSTSGAPRTAWATRATRP